MPRRLPSPAETRRILAHKRTRPQFRPPPPAGRSLAKMIKALDERFGQGAGALEARWREIVGEVLAARTEPAKLTKGRGGQPGSLEIRVQGPAAALIQHQSSDILARVNLILGHGTVGRLRIVQGPVKPRPSAGAKAAARARRAPPPLDAAAEETLSGSLEGVKSDRLKAELLRLGRAATRSGRGEDR
jgi:hypothetical protein